MLGRDFIKKYWGQNNAQKVISTSPKNNRFKSDSKQNDLENINIEKEKKSILTLLNKHCPSDAHHKDLRSFIMACYSIDIDINILMEFKNNILVRVSNESSYSNNDKQLEKLIKDIYTRYPGLKGKNVNNNKDHELTKLTNTYEWEPPLQLNQPLPEVLPLNPEMLPESIRPWLVDISNRMKCPIDFVAVTAIVMLGSLIGARCGIKPKQKDDWLVIPNLWGGIVGTPSQLKTPSIAAILKGLGILEDTAFNNYSTDKVTYEVDKEIVKAKKEVLKKDLQKATKEEDKGQIEKLKSELVQLSLVDNQEPTLKRYKSNDSTIEKLADLLKENPNGLLVFRDELVGLLASWEKQGHENDRAFYLEGWSGNSPYTVDRISRGTIFIERVCLSVFGGIQISKLSGYLHRMLQWENDGMIQRFQLMVYPDEPKNWSYVDQYPDIEAKNRAYEIVQKLAELIPTEYGALQKKSESVPFFRFSLEAQEVFKKWITQLETEKLRSVDYSPIMKEHLAKYRSLMPSLALIFHLVDCIDNNENNGRVSVEAAEKAVKWCDYLEYHANRIYHGLGNTTQLAAIELSKKVKSGVLGKRFTVREIQRKGWYMLNSNSVIKDALSTLIDANWIIEEQQKNKGGRPPAPVYLVNPLI